MTEEGATKSRQAGERGGSPVASILALVVGGGLCMVLLSLFLTGLAQKQILPMMRARMERTIASAKARVAARADTAGVAADTTNARGAEADSLEALLTQTETQRKLLETQKAELARMRGSMDSVVALYRGAQNKETGRQAKLLAAMRPEEAARILDAMDDASVSQLLKLMNARAASQVLARLDSRRAARLSMTAMGAAAAEQATP